MQLMGLSGGQAELSLLLTGSLPGLLFDLKDGGITLPRNVGKFVPHYTASHPTNKKYSYELFICNLLN
jgi:hypothetical protein